MGAFMATAGVKPGLVYSSPFLRALETVRIACGRLGYKEDIKTDEGLAPGCEPVTVLKLIRSATPAALLLAGHAPDMGIICSALVGGGRIAFKKGALACIDYNPGTGDGELLFLVWPGILPD
jgi:phosphohistidine phosphatase SixA